MHHVTDLIQLANAIINIALTLIELVRSTREDSRPAACGSESNGQADTPEITREIDEK